MNFKKFAVIFLYFAHGESLLKVAPITPRAADNIVKMINTARANVPAVNIQFIKWNQPLADKLVEYCQLLANNWFFKRISMPNPLGYGNHTIIPNKTFNLNNSFNGFHLMKFPPFNTMFSSYDFVIHDTMVNPGRLSFIFQFRLNQMHCINWDKCDSSSYQSFKSCGEPLVQVQSQRCSWATQYVPRLMFSNLTELGCVTFKEHGPSAPIPQIWSFFCYGKKIEPVNDVPFERIKSGRNLAEV